MDTELRQLIAAIIVGKIRGTKQCRQILREASEVHPCTWGEGSDRQDNAMRRRFDS
jgi:hypothetical protein